jgi:hypothetical protein
MTEIRDLFLLLPFLLTGGALVAYSTVMRLFSVYRVYAFVAFSPFLLAGIALLLLGPAVVAVVRRSERPVDWTPGAPTDVAEGAASPTVGAIPPDPYGNPVGPEGSVRRAGSRLRVRRCDRCRHPARRLFAGE